MSLTPLTTAPAASAAAASPRPFAADHGAPRTGFTTLRELRHDLADSLTPALGQVQRLLRTLPESAPTDQRRALESIQERITRAVRLVDNAAVRRPAHCDLVALLASALAALPEERFRDAHVRLAGGVPLAGIWDEREIVQVLVNLLLDAARASPPGTPVAITLAASPRPTRDAPSGRARVLVQVHGSGVRRRGMERFFRGHRSRTAREAGSLQVSRGLAEAAGGRLSVTRRGGGASYILELPLSPPSSSGN